MKRILALLAAVMILSGCSGDFQSSMRSQFGVQSPKASQVTDSHCIDIFVQAYATGESQGAYDCLSPSLQYHYFAKNGIKDDKGLNNFLRLAKGFVGTYDVQQWTAPIPPDVWQGRNPKNGDFVPVSGDVTRAYFLYPKGESDGIGYYTDGYSLMITVDTHGKIVDIE